MLLSTITDPADLTDLAAACVAAGDRLQPLVDRFDAEAGLDLDVQIGPVLFGGATITASLLQGDLVLAFVECHTGPTNMLAPEILGRLLRLRVSTVQAGVERFTRAMNRRTAGLARPT